MRKYQLCLELVLVILLSALAKADDLQRRYVEKNGCDLDRQALMYPNDVRLDKSQNAFLVQFKLSESGERVLFIEQYKDEGQKCGVIRDAILSKDPGSYFVWECADISFSPNVIIGTWPERHPSVRGPALEMWRVDLDNLKFVRLQEPATCYSPSYAGEDKGDDLAKWARERAARHGFVDH